MEKFLLKRVILNAIEYFVPTRIIVDENGNSLSQSWLSGGAKTENTTLATTQDVTASYADVGSEIDAGDYGTIGFFVDYVVNDSDNVSVKIIGLDGSGGNEYEIDGSSERGLFTASDSDGFTYFEVDLGTLRYVKLQVEAETVGATAGTLTVKYNLK